MPFNEKQLENYLKNHGIDTSVTLNSELGFYSIRFICFSRDNLFTQ